LQTDPAAGRLILKNLLAPPPSRTERIESVLYGCGVLLLATTIVLGLLEPLAAIWQVVPRDCCNEGWNALFADVALRGGVLYPDGPFVVNNYPPLSFYIVGAVGRWVGDNIIAGRLIALASLVVVAGNIFKWLRFTGSSSKIALIGALSLLAMAVVFAPDYVAMNDPQWLAHALMTTGWVLLWRPANRLWSDRKGYSRNLANQTGSSRVTPTQSRILHPGTLRPGTILAAVVVMLTAGLIKHLLIPLPLITTIWLARKSRADLRKWLIGSVGLLIVLGPLLLWVYGPPFFHSLLADRKYSLAYLLPKLEHASIFFAPMLALAAAAFVNWRARERDVFVVLYAMSSFSLGILVSAGAGLDANAFFDAMIAASLLLAIAVEKLSGSSAPAVGPAAHWGSMVAFAAGLYLLARIAIAMPSTLEARRSLPGAERQTLLEVQSIARWGGGAAGCENPALCYWAGQPLVFDVFAFSQKIKTGELSADSCVALFASGAIKLLQLSSRQQPVGIRLFPSKCNSAIRAHYVEIGVAGNDLLLRFDATKAKGPNMS
jgi:hypothetical protein